MRESLRTGSWTISKERRSNMCEDAKRPRDYETSINQRCETDSGMLGGYKSVDTAKDASSIYIGSLRKRLEVEEYRLSKRLNQIRSVLSNLTPEVELSIQIQQQLKELGIQ